MNTDREWEKWGKQDPYYGVIAHDRFRNKNLTYEVKMDFFESGVRDVDNVISTIRYYFDQDFHPQKILDFGCGVGRLIIPFSKISDQVVGVDVSDSMLEEANKNCREHSVNNVKLIKSDGDLISIEEKFDLIHSFIVMQHIDAERGLLIINDLIKHLNDEGICAIQLTYSRSIYKKNHGMPPIQTSVDKTKNKIMNYYLNFKNYISNTYCFNLKNKKLHKDPVMQMNSYDLNKVLFLIQSAGIKNIHVEFTDHGGYLGMYLFFQSPKLL